MAKWFTLILGLVACLSANADPLYWHDGDGQWQLWPSDDEIAVFTPVPASGRFKATDMDAAVVKAYPSMQIWKLPPGAKPFASKALQKQAWSPVFYEFPNKGGRRMVPTGGVLVRFKPDWSRDKIAAWLANRGLKNMEFVFNISHTVAVESSAGLASLTLANALHKEQAVIHASPNWWIEVEPR